MEHVIELRDFRGVPLREAIDVLVDARATRRTAEVQEAVGDPCTLWRTTTGTCPRTRCRAGAGWSSWPPTGGPRLNEFVPLELAAALGVSQQSITLLIADLLDLEYRHPLLWRQVCSGDTPLWQARKIAQRVSSVGLGRDAALELDRQLSPTLPGLTVGRSLKLLEGLIAAVDPRAPNSGPRPSGASGGSGSSPPPTA